MMSWGRVSWELIQAWFNLNNHAWDIDESPPIQFNKWSQFISLVEDNYGN